MARSPAGGQTFSARELHIVRTYARAFHFPSLWTDAPEPRSPIGRRRPDRPQVRPHRSNGHRAEIAAVEAHARVGRHDPKCARANDLRPGREARQRSAPVIGREPHAIRHRDAVHPESGCRHRDGVARKGKDWFTDRENAARTHPSARYVAASPRERRDVRGQAEEHQGPSHERAGHGAVEPKWHAARQVQAEPGDRTCHEQEEGAPEHPTRGTRHRGRRAPDHPAHAYGGSPAAPDAPGDPQCTEQRGLPRANRSP